MSMRRIQAAGVFSFVVMAITGAHGMAQTPATPSVATAQAAPAEDRAAAAVPMKPQEKKGRNVPVPAAVVELPATPMLDEEGRQRVDPEGKPMFNPPVRQQRDKKGQPVFDENGKAVFQTPSEPGYDEHGRKLKGTKEKAAKTVAVSILRGTLTVDGLIGKAALNYEISDFKYIYFYAPWIGTAIVANAPFPGSTLQKNAFDQHTLTVTVDEHTFQVYSDTLLLGKKPEPAYVLVDRDFRLATNSPVMGFGTTAKAPYTWPGARGNAAERGLVQPPPIPASLKPKQLPPPLPQR